MCYTSFKYRHISDPLLSRVIGIDDVYATWFRDSIIQTKVILDITMIMERKLYLQISISTSIIVMSSITFAQELVYVHFFKEELPYHILNVE